jgi:hypothetical protein
MNTIIAFTLSIAILYAWAGGCFLLFRFIRPESEDRLRRFLETHYGFFTECAFGETRRQATREAIRESGRRGWLMIGLPIIILGFGLTVWHLVISSAVLFFGGLMFAYSWYGLRCLRILGLDTYAKQATDSAANGSQPIRSETNRTSSAAGSRR